MAVAFWQKAHELSQAGQPFVVVTSLSSRGHAPADPGAKAIITREGLEWGTVGGGKIEARCIIDAKELLTQGSTEPRLVTWNLQRDIGMTCGGEVTYLFEPHKNDAWHIVIFGAGHCAQALVRTLEPLDCKITCLDTRAEWLEKLPRSPKIEARLSKDLPAEVATFSKNCFFIAMTQGHATDMPILDKLLSTRADAPYLGSIGSDIKAIKVRSELKTLGHSAERIDRLYCPIGLPLGNNQPAEIAISIAAQLLQVRQS